MPPLRLMPTPRFARLLSAREKLSSQSVQCSRHMATSYSERDKPSREMNSAAAQPGGMAGSRTVDSEHLEDRNRRFQRAPSPNVSGPTDFHGRSGPSGIGYGDNSRWDHMAGEANGRAFLNSHAVGDDTETYDDHAMSSTDNNAFKQHMRHGGNATVPKGDSMARLHDRGALKDGFSKPDGENWRPQGDIPRVVTSLQKGETPRWHGMAPRAEEYNVRKAQVHASLWQQEIRKQEGKATSVDENANSVSIASESFPFPRNGSEASRWDSNKNMPEDWETFIRPEEEFNEETAVKEEAMMLEEFERRKEKNRIQIASFVKQHLYARRRPVDGWKYIVNNFGSESKGAKGSALKLDGRQVRANDMEKMTLRREGVRSGRRTE